MATDFAPNTEHDVATLPEQTLEHALRRAAIIESLALSETVWHEAADAAVQAINESIIEARHNPETARSLFELASYGRHDPASLEQLRATFAKEGIPPEFLSHYKPDGSFAYLRKNDGLSDNF
ncbi:hypothetical protein ABO04_05925 [Nitrosomonas sp. HPC101]|nr:hypothetical protein [Nitrosomonas sp. HPC101]